MDHHALYCEEPTTANGMSAELPGLDELLIDSTLTRAGDDSSSPDALTLDSDSLLQPCLQLPGNLSAGTPATAASSIANLDGVDHLLSNWWPVHAAQIVSGQHAGSAPGRLELPGCLSASSSGKLLGSGGNLAAETASLRQQHLASPTLLEPQQAQTAGRSFFIRTAEPSHPGEGLTPRHSQLDADMPPLSSPRSSREHPVLRSRANKEGLRPLLDNDQHLLLARDSYDDQEPGSAGSPSSPSSKAGTPRNLSKDSQRAALVTNRNRERQQRSAVVRRYHCFLPPFLLLQT